MRDTFCRIFVILGAALASLFTGGCFNYQALSDGDLASPTRDMATPLDLTIVDLTPPLDFTPPPDLIPSLYYNPTIQADVDALGCASTSCHAVSSGTYAPLLQAMPGPLALTQNYNNILVDSQNGDTSFVLTKNLVGSGVTHGGGAAGTKPFASTNDTVYVRWKTWIEEGSRL